MWKTSIDSKRKLQRVAKSAVHAVPLHASRIETDEDLLDFVEQVIDKFRHWAESMGGWRVFWRGESESIPEQNMQLLFLAVLKGYCEIAGVRLDREVETGRGPIDFTFSGDKRTRVLVEMKKLTHKNFWQGLRVQMPIYMRSQEVAHAIFLAVRDSDTNPMTKRWQNLSEEAVVVSRESGLSIRVKRIDVLRKESASKAKKV